MKLHVLIYTLLGGLLILQACEKEDDVNPFDEQEVNQDTVQLELTDPDPNSIAGIYTNILKPTCANVGCHDGTFEPDYRTLESAYNTLVFQVPIKNDGQYNYRVEPFKPETSVIMGRLQGTLTPQMPIQLEPDSDWPDKKDQYIENIRTWIANGAPDVMGNVRQMNYPRPDLLGAGAAVDGEWLNRSGGSGPIQMPGDSVEATFFFSFRHDELDAEQLEYNKIAFSHSPNHFDSVVQYDLNILGSPRYERGFYGEIVEYTHSIQIQTTDAFSLDREQWYFRVYVQDDQNPVTEIPTDDGIFYIKSYMSFRWME